VSLQVVLHLLPLLRLRGLNTADFALGRQSMPSKALLYIVLFRAHHLYIIVGGISVPTPLLRVYLPIYVSDYVLDFLVSPLVQAGQVSWRNFFLDVHRYGLHVRVCLLLL
jgi:hypothetical protein